MSGTKAPQSGDGHSLTGAAPRTPLFVPSSMDIAATQITEFIRYFEEKEKKKFNKYSVFERIAVDDFRAFWRHFTDWSGVIYNGDLFPVCTSDRCEEAVFFPNLRLNYVENLLSHGNDCDAKFEIPALTAYHLERPAERLSRRELRHRVSTLAAALRDLGLGPESRVVIVAHNTAGAVVGCLAAAAIGCSVSTAAPEMGVFALVSRFAQIEPALLMCDLHGVYVGRERHQYQRLAETVQSLPSLRGVLLLDQGPIPEGLPVPVYRATELMAACDGAVMKWPRFPFNHPLFILFTSGTTGVPKCIVHGAGGTLLEHLKEHQLHCNLGERDKLFFQTSIGWMMWNWQLTALASGAELVVYDGPLASVDLLWRIVAEEEVTVFGTSPAYIQISGASTADLVDRIASL